MNGHQLATSVLCADVFFGINFQQASFANSSLTDMRDGVDGYLVILTEKPSCVVRYDGFIVHCTVMHLEHFSTLLTVFMLKFSKTKRADIYRHVMVIVGVCKIIVDGDQYTSTTRLK